MSATEQQRETQKPTGLGPGTAQRVNEATIEYEDNLILDESGRPGVFSLTFEVKNSEEMLSVGRALERAGSGVTGKMRDQAKRRAFFDAFEVLVIRAGNYAGAEGLSRSELRDYFEGKRIPEGTPEEDRKFWTEAYERHVTSALVGFTEGLKIRPTFRG